MVITTTETIVTITVQSTKQRWFAYCTRISTQYYDPVKKYARVPME
uniref:Uncharacterized protein n=1 Tax=Rhizophora mucronata TaxID=61149 RepID=A0A2P2NR30_RHIMU